MTIIDDNDSEAESECLHHQIHQNHQLNQEQGEYVDDFELNTELEENYEDNDSDTEDYNYKSAAAATAKEAWNSCIDFEMNNATTTETSNFLELIEIDGRQDSIAEGLGFSVTGNRTSGVYVKHVVGGSTAEKDGRLKVGDLLLKINEIELVGLSADQVARILRFCHQKGDPVRLTVAHAKEFNGPKGRQICGRPRNAIRQFRASFSDHSISTLASVSNLPTTAAGQVSESGRLLPLLPVRRSQTQDTFLTNSVGLSNSSSEISRSGPLIDLLNSYDEIEKFPQISTSNHQNMKLSQSNITINVRPQVSTNKIMDLIHEALPPSRQETLSMDEMVQDEAYENSLKSGDNRRSWSDDDESDDRGVISSLSSPDDNKSFRPYKKASISSDADSKNFFGGSKYLTRRNSSRLTPEDTTDDLPLVPLDQLNAQSTSSGISAFVSSSFGASRNVRIHPHPPQRTDSEGSNRLSWQCPVCLDGASRIYKTKRKLMSTVCGHVFCDHCIGNVLQQTTTLCPTCRIVLQQTEVHPLFM